MPSAPVCSPTELLPRQWELAMSQTPRPVPPAHLHNELGSTELPRMISLLGKDQAATLPLLEILLPGS